MSAMSGNENGLHITYVSNEESRDIIKGLDGLFSFSFYWNYEGEVGERYFTENPMHNKYYRGLMTYNNIIHTNPFFEKIGMIIYTNNKTLPLLQKYILGPKVIFARVNWGKYATDDGIIRCMRFHAIVEFPWKWIAVRDADTLFAKHIEGTDIGRWEENFLRGWLSDEYKERIIVGTHRNYAQYWHTNMPFPNSASDLTTEERRSSMLPSVKMSRMITRMTTENRPFFTAPLGIFAGFVNFPPGSDRIWGEFEEYLDRRFFAVPDVGLSNKYATIPGFTKDERLLVFSLLVKHFDQVFFFTIDYNNERYLYVDLYDSEYPNRVFEIENENDVILYKDAYYRAKFGPFLEEYAAWMAAKTPANRLANYKKFIEQSYLVPNTSKLFYKKTRGGRRRRQRLTKKHTRK